MSHFESLASQLDGDLLYDISSRVMYATDASVYREIPLAVCRPRNKADLKKVLAFSHANKIPLVPRTAGTSLAGQVVGGGIVVDFSKYMNSILEFDATGKWVKVEPGVILDSLNDFLKPHGLMFGPETSTSNRCMIGGMVGNNACGSHSLVYGSTRDHTLEIEAILSDGSEVVFGDLTNDAFRQKCIGNTFENSLYRHIFSLLSDKTIQQEITTHYPSPELKRRNTGYALDLLLDSKTFGDSEKPFNFCKLLAGSEGTLSVFTSIKLNLVPLPPPEKALVCIHLNSIEDALHANLIALKYEPVAVELIDKVILDCTKANITQRKNRFFIAGDPGCILVVEFAEHDRQSIADKARDMEAEMRQLGYGYHFPHIFGKDIGKVWALRKAGLGLLSNMPGDAKPVAVIEDAAVPVDKLPEFIKELQVILHELSLSCVYHAHIGSGELHLRPVLNLKNPADVERFYQVAKKTASLVKKYRGSLSGEHGDGRLRAEFIPMVLSQKIADMLTDLKKAWDPDHLLNPGKITRPASMKTMLRYTPGQPARKLQTFFDYSEAGSFLQAVEKCNGSGDCRKPHTQGGTMCPSYHASLDESASTRGRANVLREFITQSNKKNAFDHKEIIDVMDLCLSCKACKSECPSNVDMARFKAEALQQYYLTHGIPFRAWLIASFAKVNKMGSIFPVLYNQIVSGKLTAWLIQHISGFSKHRTLPRLHRFTLRSWARKNLNALNNQIQTGKKLYLFLDEFTNYNDTQTGVHAILLLNRLGYQVLIADHQESGRAGLSKGLVKKAQKIACHNIRQFAGLIDETSPLVGIEPSAILGFRDEYLSLSGPELLESARKIAAHCYTFEEFICHEFEKGSIDISLFDQQQATILYHAHCHQKALSSTDFGLKMISMVPGKQVKPIECGCCGMAGSFGFEKEHYALSMAIGELSLFPAIRKTAENTLIAASGTSCRTQILDGTGRQSLHPIDLVFSFLTQKKTGQK